MSKSDFILQIPLQLHAPPHNLTIIWTLIDFDRPQPFLFTISSTCRHRPRTQRGSYSLQRNLIHHHPIHPPFRLPYHLILNMSNFHSIAPHLEAHGSNLRISFMGIESIKWRRIPGRGGRRHSGVNGASVHKMFGHHQL